MRVVQLLILTSLLGCTHAKNTQIEFDVSAIAVNDTIPTPPYLSKEQIYSGAEDSPQELYKFLSRNLKHSLIDSICKTKSDLCLVLTATIRAGKIDSVGFVMGFTFDPRGKGNGHIEQFDELANVLNNFRKATKTKRTNPKVDKALLIDFNKLCK